MIKFTHLLLVAFVAQNDGAGLIRPFLPYPRLDGRIVGGSQTPIEELPYQLSLQSFGVPICGASIISSKWALTAAHCATETTRPTRISLRAGSSVTGSGGSVHQAVEIVVHPNYRGNSDDWDYALIRVGAAFPLGQPGVAAIQLADSEPGEGVESVTSGWGRLSAGGLLPSSLQSVTVPIISRQDCQDMYTQYPITDRMVCAGLVEGGKDACTGDSGGPLVSGNRLVGVVSWGNGCAGRRQPGVYSNVANQRSWIRGVTGV